MHIRAALRAGLSADELAEVFLHTAVYAGVPNSNAALALVDRAVDAHSVSGDQSPSRRESNRT
jgi:3-oxoadipate enol-lactonase/4-carboxymuconolactone decarboxylase